MSRKIYFSYTITKQAQKQLKNFSTRDQKIFKTWINNNLSNVVNPRNIGGKKLRARKKDIRFKVSHHLRLVLIINDDTKTLEIIRFMRRASKNYSHTKAYFF